MGKMQPKNITTKSVDYTKKMVLIAMFAASITGGKLALMAIANVEVVTLLIMLYTYIFGLTIALPATLIFVAVETAIWGVNSWVISYFIYWPLISIVTALFKKLIKKNEVIFPSLIAGILTTMFGVLTSFVDALFYTTPDILFKYFGILYARGASFYITHIVSNILILGICFKPLAKVFTKLKGGYFREVKVENLAELEGKKALECDVSDIVEIIPNGDKNE